MYQTDLEIEGQTTAVFCCEDSVDGIFTAVYDAWASNLGLRNVTVQAGENQNFQLFAQYYPVETDHEKAAKVADTIRKRLGMEDYEILYQAALSGDREKGEAIFRTIVLGLAVVKRKNITRNLQQPAVAKVFELSRNVGNEAHHYRMFVRFHELEREEVSPVLLPREETQMDLQADRYRQETDSSIMFSEIKPQNQVLPILGDHFSDRFPMVNFMIYDHTHGECLLHQAGMQWVIMQGIHLEEERIHRYSRREREYARLWKGFVSSIAIEERKNPRCQMNFMPKRFWKYMTEHQ